MMLPTGSFPRGNARRGQAANPDRPPGTLQNGDADMEDRYSFSAGEGAKGDVMQNDLARARQYRFRPEELRMIWRQ